MPTDIVKTGTSRVAKDEQDVFKAAVRWGFAQTPKRLPHILLYDAEGCAHFDAIAEAEHYYLTKCELEILERIPPALDATIAPDSCTLVYFGGALSRKSARLLNHMSRVEAFVPVDISEQNLHESAIELKLQHIDLQIRPLHANFGALDRIPRPRMPGIPLGFFPGSTIGQYAPDDAVTLLSSMRRFLGSPALLLLGVDLVKSADILLSAYNQPDNSQFVLHVLERMRDELKAEIDPNNFFLNPVFEPERLCIDHTVECRTACTVRMDGEAWAIAAGERLLLASSHKYTVAGIESLATQAGWTLRQVWHDKREYFAECLFAA